MCFVLGVGWWFVGDVRKCCCREWKGDKGWREWVVVLGSGGIYTVQDELMRCNPPPISWLPSLCRHLRSEEACHHRITALTGGRKRIPALR